MQITYSIQDGGLMKSLQASAPKVQRRAKDKLRETSLALERAIKEDMPVDKGRARASWGHWTPQDIVKPDKDASPNDAFWKVGDGGFKITQGTNVVYVPDLNRGHSMQAPAGFIDKDTEKAGVALQAALMRVVGEVF